jgi:nitroreductase
MTPQFFLTQLVERTNIAPKRLVAPGPDPEQLNLIFSAAAQAPDHGRIQPWRFVLIPENKRADLGHAFVQALKTRDASASPAQTEAAYDKAFRAPCLMLAILKDHASDPSIPTAERLISLGCAIQNMLLMAQMQGWGSGITSGQAMNSAPIRDLFKLDAFEQGICFLNFGTVTTKKPARGRPSCELFVSSL